ncbi:MAG: hypothetical protein ABSF09_12600 [Candidatus Bathyarchaeia archaeon]|jgi:hypothetical protein
MKEDNDQEKKIEYTTANAKDYLAFVIAMAETTMLPLILLLVVLAGVGLVISLFLLH